MKHHSSESPPAENGKGTTKEAEKSSESRNTRREGRKNTRVKHGNITHTRFSKFHWWKCIERYAMWRSYQLQDRSEVERQVTRMSTANITGSTATTQQEKEGLIGSSSRKDPRGVIIAEETELMIGGRIIDLRKTTLLGARRDTCIRSRDDSPPEDHLRAPGKGT
ncbi:hypothetical protein PIB30_025363 [Stylosanthes scabra]|uniref:Uncharacterized protein n=1 Tax=Stylosanthes scabra TaxID=79078 RepID=A0ABU6Y8C5_9FABA|nr:hypothetical protein [Stylosanthes scabra]